MKVEILYRLEGSSKREYALFHNVETEREALERLKKQFQSIELEKLIILHVRKLKSNHRRPRHVM